MNAESATETLRELGPYEGAKATSIQSLETEYRLPTGRRPRERRDNVSPYKLLILFRTFDGGPSRNRTGVHGFAVRCVTTPPSGPVTGKLVVEGP